MSWLATDDPAKGHLFSIPSALIGYDGPEKIRVAGLESCKLEGVDPILDTSVFRRGFTFRSQRLAQKEALKLAKFAETNNIKTVVIYEGAFFELEVARLFANIVDTSSIVVNLFSATNWRAFFESADAPALKAFKERYLRVANLTVSVETEALGDLVKRKLGHYSPVYPVFSCLDTFDFTQVIQGKLTRNEADSGVICVSVGSASHLPFTKALLGSLYKAERSLRVNVIFQSQSNLGAREAKELDSAFANHVLKIHYGVLSDLEYAQILATSAVVLFTYDKNKYKLQSSGRVQDALLMKCVPVVESETALVGQIRLAGNETAYTFERESMQSAINAVFSALHHKSPPVGFGVPDFVSWALSLAKDQQGQFIPTKDQAPLGRFPLPRFSARFWFNEIIVRNRLRFIAVRRGLRSP